MAMRTFPFTLPVSGNKITFREPYQRDRQGVMSMVTETGPSPDELLAYSCIETINGNQPRDKDPRHITDPWHVKDISAYLTLFTAMFSLSREEVTGLHALAKKLRDGDGATSQESNQQTATTSASQAQSALTADTYSAPPSANPVPSEAGAVLKSADGCESVIDPSLHAMLQLEENNP